jgi:hypothetical protein
MGPLDERNRSLGGTRRAERQEEWERKFVATLAASSRPLKRDNPASPEEQAQMLKDEEGLGQFPWIALVGVGANGNQVHARDPKATKLIREMGGLIGFAGIIMLNKRLCIFTRPLKAGTDVEQRLIRVANDLQAKAEQFLREAVRERMRH